MPALTSNPVELAALALGACLALGLSRARVAQIRQRQTHGRCATCGRFVGTRRCPHCSREPS